MGWDIVVRGIGVGIAVAAPVGPIGVIVLQNALRDGFWRGVSAGLGAVLGDGVFALATGFGLTAISGKIMAYNKIIMLAGAGLLLFMGVRTFFARPSADELALGHAETGRPTVGFGAHIALLATTFFITIGNPATLMGFIFIFSSVGGLIQRPGDYTDATILVISVMLGSLLWWSFLSAVATRLRDHLTARALRHIHHISGGLILAFGAFVIAEVFRTYWAR